MPPEIIALTRQVRALWHRFDWLPEWAVTSLVLLVFVGGGWLTHKIAFAILRRMVGRRTSSGAAWSSGRGSSCGS